MKKILLLITLLPLCLHAQNSFPSYPNLLIEFLKQYSYTADEPVDGINFAKKKDGWHVQVIDRITEKVKNDQLFWSATTQAFLPVTGFGAPVQEFQLEDALTSMLQSTGFFNVYSYERCRYYGYNGWTEDMISEFGGGDKQIYSDTLLEGLARSYSLYGSKFLWYQYGGAAENTDTLKRKLGVLEIPSARRIDTVNNYISKAVETFQILTSKNNRYMTTVGNPQMKVFNEQMNGYMQMSMAGYDQLATNYINNITPNVTIITLAKKYLAGCPPHAIIFTFGDNDTYPLWYVQQSQKFRKDVAVINIGLLGLPIYIHMLKRNNLVSFSTTPKTYGDSSFIYFIKQAGNTKRSSLTTFLNTIKNKTNPYQSEWYGIMASYSEDQLLFNIDLSKFKKIAAQPNFSPVVRIPLGDYITNDQFMVLDIINANIYNRPIYFSAAYDMLNGYLQRQGLLFQFLPLDTTKTAQTETLAMAKTVSYLKKIFSPTSSNNFSAGLVTDYNQDAVTYGMFTDVARYYLKKNRKDSALYWINTLKKWYTNDLPYTPNLIDLAGVLIDAGLKHEGHELLQQQIEFMFHLYQNPSAYYPYMSRKTVLNSAVNAQLLCEINHLDRKKIDDIASYLNKKDY